MHHELLDLLHGEELLDHGPGVVVDVELEPGAGSPVPSVLGRQDGGDQQQERDHRDHDDSGDRATLSGVCRFRHHAAPARLLPGSVRPPHPDEESHLV